MNGNEELLATVRKSLNDEVLPRHLGYLEALLLRSSSGWIADTPQPSIADFILVPRLQWLGSGIHSGISADILTPLPAIRSLIDRLNALSAVVAYRGELMK